MTSELLELGGTFRTRTAEETLEAIKPHFARFGITRLANVTGLDTMGIPVWIAIRPAARSLTVSQGKGSTDALAMVSAAMESIELYHGEVCVPPGTSHALGQALRSDEFVDPRALPIRSTAEFREEKHVLWVDATDYETGEVFKVPRELLDRDALVSNAYERVFISTSNGLASGNTRDEAIIHALSEVIERDQAAFWTVREGLTQPTPGSQLDLETVDDPLCVDLIARIRRSGLRVAVWHLAEASDVPTFTCSIWDEDKATLYPSREGGRGTHPYKRVALSRALTEAVQSRLTHISGARDDVFWYRYRDKIHIDEHQPFMEHMRTAAKPIDYREVPEAPPMLDAPAMLRWLIARLKACTGSRCLVVDLSAPELPFSVVQVIAPGLDIKPHNALYTPSPRMMAYLSRLDLLV